MPSLTTKGQAITAVREQICAARLALGWTQKELAARAGMSLPSYQVFEAKGQIALKTFWGVLEALGQLDDFRITSPALPTVEWVLSFLPTLGQKQAVREIDLARLAAQAKLGFKDDRSLEALELRRATGSAGGARPKALVTTAAGGFCTGAVNHEGCVSLILKFQEDADTPLPEHALSLTARQCGIDAVESLLVSGADRQGGSLSHFAARRFDRLKKFSAIAAASTPLPEKRIGEVADGINKRFETLAR
jgi:transcriptional regulator with XRE-family HTH domain